MKLLHREDVLEAGHDLPTTGLCANIGPTEMEGAQIWWRVDSGGRTRRSLPMGMSKDSFTWW
jgi:hypothetical protein